MQSLSYTSWSHDDETYTIRLEKWGRKDFEITNIIIIVLTYAVANVIEEISS
jgi:hypothetical protein